MMHRVWDEVCCEFGNASRFHAPMDPDDEDIDDSVVEEHHKIDGLDIKIGYFNDGRHIYVEVEGADMAVKAFEEAFLIVLEVYEIDWNVGEIAKILSDCGASNLIYLRQRKEEHDDENEEVSERAAKRAEANDERWRQSEWHDLGKLAQAARDAGWQEAPSVAIPSPKMHSFYHDIGPNSDGNRLRLGLMFDDSREIHEELWLHDSSLVLYRRGGTSSFGGWGMMPENPFVQDIGFIDRWLGIPTPAHAIAALKHVCTWNEHMRSSCSQFVNALDF